MALQQLVVQIQGLSGSSDDLDSLHTHLKSTASEAVLKQNTAALVDSLGSLNHEAHSLGCLYLLEARGRSMCSTPPGPSQSDADFLSESCRFLLVCTPSQIQRAPAKFTSLCRAVTTAAKALNKPKHALLPLHGAISKLTSENTDLLTPIHADFFELCLLTKCYSAAATIVLHQDVTSVDPNKTACTATDVLLYCYYGGMIATGLKNYSRALDLYMMAITAPTLVLNAITVAALKKYILVSILHHDGTPSTTGGGIVLPRHTAQTVVRSMKTECAVYNEFAKLCTGSVDKTIQELTQFATSRGDVFVADGNAGLVKLIIETTPRRKIQRLTETYITLSLAEVARQVGLNSPNEAEEAIVAMISADQISAKINHAHGMVEFLSSFQGGYDASTNTNSEDTVQRIDALIKSAHALAIELEHINHDVSMDRAFLTKTELASSGGGRGGGSNVMMKMSKSQQEMGDFAMLDDMDVREAFQPS